MLSPEAEPNNVCVYMSANSVILSNNQCKVLIDVYMTRLYMSIG